jgi:ATP/ADP translocase
MTEGAAWPERLFSLLTGARSGERARTGWCFLATFFLLASYYLVKPLRSSQFLKDFDAGLMPLFFLLIAVLSFVLTKAFNFCYDRIPVYRLIGYTFVVMMALKLGFMLALPLERKSISLVFYLWAAVYFLLCNAVLWGCINSLYRSEAAERCFGFISIGAATGGISGAYFSEQLATGSWRQLILPVSAVLMGLALLCLYQAARVSGQFETQQAGRNSRQKERQPFWSDVQHLWQQRYIRAIAAMVFSLAVLNTVLEFQGLKTLDAQLTRRYYLHEFQALDQALNQVQGRSQPLNPDGLALLKALKPLSAEQRVSHVRHYLQMHHLSLSVEQLLTAYRRYQDQLESATRELLSTIYKHQGLIGLFLLFVAARPLYRLVGLRSVLMFLPLLFTAVCLALFFPLELIALEWMLTTTYALNYSLYRTSRELLYTQSDNEARFKLKPLIEGPIVRLGDVTASVLKLGLMAVLVWGMGLPERQVDFFYLGAALLILCYWLHEAWYAGGHYQHLSQQRESTR